MENTTAVASTNVIVNAAASVAVSVDSSVVMDAFSTGWKNELVMGSANLKVRTNNEAGYSMYIATADNTTSMVNYANLDGGEITALTSDKLSSEFEGNSWGYSLMEGTVSPDASTTRYSGISKDMTMIANPSTKTEEDSYTLAFAAQIDQSLSSGQYMNSVMISVVANPATINDLNDLIYMQDMTPEICKNTKAKNGASTVTPGNEVTKQLIDIRDGKKYWVAKLADNNCWMTQNLDYDMVAGKVLTPSDTNVSANYTIKTTTETKVPAVIDVSANNNAAYYTERSWNMGDYVLATPLKGITCNNPNVSTESPNTDAYNSLRYGDTFDRCSDFQNVAGWLPTYQAQTGNWKGAQAGNGGEAAAEGLVAADAATKTYDAHYLIGNYYQYNAATLGSAPASVNTKIDTTRSICPKGWKLPTSGNTGSGSGTNTTTTAFVNKDDSFYNLLAEYGYANSKGYNWNNGNPYTSIIKGTSADNYLNNTAASPLYYVRGGHVTLDTGALRYAGLDSYYWSATTYPNATNAHYLDFSSTNVNPSYYSTRFYGFSVGWITQVL